MARCKASTSDFNQILWYRDRALSMMCVCEISDLLEFDLWFNRFDYVANFMHVPKDKMGKFFDIMVNDDVHNHVQREDPSINLRGLPYKRKIYYYFDIIIGSKIYMYRLCFRHRNQYEKEPIKHYANYLQILIKKSEYQRKFPKEIICKKFFNGLREDVIKTHLRGTNYESLDEIAAKAIEFEKDHLITYYRDYAFLKINIYNKEKEGEFNVWLNKFEYVADTIDVPENKIVKLFMEMVDNDVNLNVMRDNPSYTITEFPYNRMIYLYLRYLYPDVIELYRERIFCRKQYEQETIGHYARSLKNLFNECIGTSFLERKLLKHFIKGLREKEVKNHLRRTQWKSFNKMVVSAIKFAKENLITYYRDRALLRIDIYNERNEGRFIVWLNKFEYVAYTIDVPECEMGKFFIEMIDNDSSQSVMQANPSVDFNELSYDKKKDYYNKFYSLDDIDVHRKSFKSRQQYEQEPTKTYAYFFQKYYEKSNHVKTSYKYFYKRFLYGLRENDTRNYLEKFPNLSFEESVKKAIEFEKVNLLSHYRDQALVMINIYNPRKEGLFYNWLYRFNYVTDKIIVPENKKGKLFLAMIDNTVKQNVMQAFPFVEFFELSYNQIIQYYLVHFPPPRSEKLKRLLCPSQF